MEIEVFCVIYKNWSNLKYYVLGYGYPNCDFHYWFKAMGLVLLVINITYYNY